LHSHSNPKPAPIHSSTNFLPDGKLKQAIISSKQPTFNNLSKLKDQIARPAEVQPDISKELPPPPEPTAKVFVPSPELSSLFNSHNQMHDHFHPLDQYMRPPTKDARFPFEHPYSAQAEFEHKWLAANRSPNDIGMLRNTHVEFPHHHESQINFHHHSDLYHARHNHHHLFSGERMVFPSEASAFSNEIKGNWPPPPPPSRTPEPNHNERTKGTWKWIPENDEEESEPPEGRFHAFHTGPVIYDSPRPHTVRDRPYSFESSDIFNQQTTPPTGPGNGNGENAQWAIAEALVTGEEMLTTTKSDESERSHLDVKLLR
jgi:hypothetical protein